MRKTNLNLPYLNAPTEKRDYPLKKTVTRIGRSKSSDIVVDNKLVSRDHARLLRDESQVFLKDMDSANGTYINEERLLGKTQLKHGDKIGIGKKEVISFVFCDPETTDIETPFPKLELVDREFYLNRHKLKLSQMEFSLLSYLYERRNKICTKYEIGAEVWKYEGGEIPSVAQIENLISLLRKKIKEDPKKPLLLITVPSSKGYKLVSKRETD